MTDILSIDNLSYYLKTRLIEQPTIIYFAIGSENLQYRESIMNSGDENAVTQNKIAGKWKPHENQQFPPFLHDFKLSNMDVNIIIVLIDMEMSLRPYIINEPERFYSDTWKDGPYCNIYNSEYGIEVISIRECLGWDDEKTMFSSFKLFDIRPLMVDLCDYILSTNTLLFYQEFTGNNTINLEYEIKEKYPYFDNKKVCIDITRGSDNSCFFDMDKPEAYPIIKYKKGILEYVSFDNLDIGLQRDIIIKIPYFIKNDLISENLVNPKFKKEYFLFCQYINKNYILLKKIRDSVLSLLRISSDKKNVTILSPINTSWQIDAICYLSKIFPSIVPNFTNIKQILLKFSEKEGEEGEDGGDVKQKFLNENISQDTDFIEYKRRIVYEECIDILRKTLMDISKINYSQENIDLLIESIMSVSDKYKIDNIIRDYCLKECIII